MQGGTGLRCRCYDQNVSRSHGMGEGCCMLEIRANDQEWGRFRKKKVRTMEVGMEILKKGYGTWRGNAIDHSLRSIVPRGASFLPQHAETGSLTNARNKPMSYK